MTDDLMDFTEPKNTKPFRVDEDVFHLELSMPVLTALEFMKTIDALEAHPSDDVDGMMKIVERLLRMMLREGDDEVFIERMTDREKPITYGQFKRILDWATQAVMGRDPQGSGSSSDGSENPESGIDSTETSLDEESTPARSLLAAS